MFGFVLAAWCHESPRQGRIIQTPSLELRAETEIIFYLCKWKFLTGIETCSPPSLTGLGMYELAVLSCLIRVFKILIWKVWMARVLTGPWRERMIPRLRLFHLVYNSWHNVHRFPEFICRPSVLSWLASFNPWPCVFWASKSCLRPISPSIRRR